MAERPVSETDAAGARWRTIVLCMAVAIVEGFDVQAIGVAAPRIARELALDPRDMAWVFSISNIGLVIGASLGGWCADRIGRKPVLAGAVLVFGLATFATMVAHDFNTLVLIRLLAGLGFGGALPNLMAAAADISRPDRRTAVATAMFCGLPFGGGCAALAIASLGPNTDWRVTFFIGGAIAVAVAALLLLFMRETRPQDAGASAAHMPSWRALFGEGRATATLLIWLSLLPTIIVLYVILNWLPSLVAAKGLSPAVAPQASLLFNFAGVAGALIAGPIVDKIGPRWSLSVVYVGLIAALAGLAQASGHIAILAYAGATGFCLLAANFSLYGVATIYYPPTVRGIASGAAMAVGRTGGVIGPLGAGYLLAAGQTAAQIILLSSAIAAMAGLALFALTFRPQFEPKPTS